MAPAPPAVRTKKNPESELSGFFSLLLILVRLAGIEPTTPWFVAKYSIQLSYSRKTSTTSPIRHGGKTFYNKTSQSLIFSILVRLAGIEPTTPWFVAKYSIQLSYSRAGKHYSVFISL